MVLAGRPPLYESGALSTELCQPCHVLAETRAVGRTYGSRGALMLRERRPVRFNSFRAEDALEISIHARDDLARDVGVRDGGVAVGERAPLRAQLFRDMEMSRLRSISSSRVLVSRTTWSSCLFGGGLGSPPVTVRASALVRLLSDAGAYPRTNAANRPAD